MTNEIMAVIMVEIVFVLEFFIVVQLYIWDGTELTDCIIAIFLPITMAVMR
jgi:hypothetical protein